MLLYLETAESMKKKKLISIRTCEEKLADFGSKESACGTDCPWKYKQYLHQLFPIIRNQNECGRAAENSTTRYCKNLEESSGAVDRLSKTLVISYDTFY